MLKNILIIAVFVGIIGLSISMNHSKNKSHTSVQTNGNRYTIESNDCIISYSPEKIRVTCYITPKPSTKPDSTRTQPRVPGVSIGY